MLQGLRVVPWKYAFKRNLDSYRRHKRRKEREEDHWRLMMEQIHKEQDEQMHVEIERRLALVGVLDRQPTKGSTRGR
jgi:hypothetical protein